MFAARCEDAALLDLWHPVAAIPDVRERGPVSTQLLGQMLVVSGQEGEEISIKEFMAPMVHGQVFNQGREVSLPVREAFGFVWTSLGAPPERLFDIPEFHETDRWSENSGSFRVHTSAGRTVENFLDLAHFPFVHEGYLGEQPYTEVKDYSVTFDDREIWATGCEFYQPIAAVSATDGQVTKYTYRLAHPFCPLLYKTSPVDPKRFDVIGIFVQPMTEVRACAHQFLSLLDETNDDATIKRFQAIIFGQDKPILENQVPKRLPLGSRAETPITADKTSIQYRRWLTELGISYGVIRDNTQRDSEPCSEIF
ncbi:MAG: aromatic ring-hydroxylating dioxygenase subunit alpha [Acidimicrobiales bacterium]|nr:aromatic ring-hydroxylating dioxygenase subunit alpha [Acidimicrobiales bacterium]